MPDRKVSNKVFRVLGQAVLCGTMLSLSFFDLRLIGSDQVPYFEDVTQASGIVFVHINGERDVKNYIPETKGGGVGFFDYNNDGWLDLLMVQGSTVERFRKGDNPQSELFRNRGDGTFENVTSRARLTHPGWGMGVTFGDYDNDGFVDIYITNLGPNRLYRNRGDGIFSDVTEEAGVGDTRWSTSAAFGDYDADGFLDLYVANYINIDFENLPPRQCQHQGTVVLCGPIGLPGAADILYRNNGDGTFSEASEKTGAVYSRSAYGLGAVWADLDNDQDLDLFVGNDATPNLLFLNRGDGTFEEMGLLSGLAVNAEGREQASMGIDLADYDNDGSLDAYLTHFADDYSTLYHNEGGALFLDVTGRARVMRAEIGLVSWGTRLIDFNHDGWKDIFHVNGHVYPYLLRATSGETFQQPETFYLNNRDGTFRDVSREAGPAIRIPRASRGTAFGDYDNDGDMDMAIANINASPTLLRTNRRDDNHWVMFRTVGRQSNRDGLGARISVITGKLEQIWEVKRAGSIYSASDPRAHFGLGTASKIDLVKVRWPSGKTQGFKDVPADRHYKIDESEGLSREF